jgi:RNA polymerase sigma-70 factor, ECF subfamily
MFVKTWLYRATINKSIDYLRTRKKHEPLDLVFNQKQDDENSETMVTDQYLLMAIDQLKNTEKVIVMLYSEGFSYKEIAETTGTKITSVGKTLSRILEKLEKELKKAGYEMHK